MKAEAKELARAWHGAGTGLARGCSLTPVHTPRWTPLLAAQCLLKRLADGPSLHIQGLTDVLSLPGR